MAIIGGTGADDVLRGTSGDDVLWGGVGNDDLMGLAGDDRLEGGAGADALNGGPGADIASYTKSPGGVRVYLDGTPGSGGDAEGDVLTEIEDVWGSRFDDRIFGDGANNRLFGGDGYDFLEGGVGADLLDGSEDGGYDRGNLGSPTAARDTVWGDTAGYTQSDAGVTVNLATGTAAGGHAEGDTLRGIEGVRGSNHADVLTARDDDPNTETHPPEGSSLWGQKGDDALHGGSGDDLLWGGKGDDTLLGGGGGDYLEGGAGADVLDGGDQPVEGTGDFAGYELSDAGVTINLATGTAQGGHAEGDTLTGIESVFGSRHVDHLTGDDGRNFLFGRDGDDTLVGGVGDDVLFGGAGADVLDGGEGIDRPDYLGSDAGVTVNLAMGTAEGGHAEGDTLAGIEGVIGSNHADHLTGDDGDNQLFGRDGDDTLDGGAGDDVMDAGAGDDELDGGAGDDMLTGGEGADVLDGGAGWDEAAYWNSDAGVSVNLATGTAQGGHAEGDTLTGIERVTGSRNHADRLTGDEGDNWLRSLDGDDTLVGAEGDDTLEGGAGADVLDGGEGSDTIWYFHSDAGVTVNLATSTPQGGHAEGDTLTRIENVTGSRNHADRLTGDDGSNRLDGLDGDDTLDGGAGEDRLRGGAGADTFVFGGGDTIRDFGDGADAIDISAFGDISADNFETTVTIRQSGNDAEVQIGEAVLTLNGVSAADITMDDFLLA